MNKSRRAALYELPTKLQNSKEELGKILEEEEEYYKYISEKFKYSKRAKESEEVVGQMQEAYKLIDEAIDILMKYLLIDYK